MQSMLLEQARDNHSDSSKHEESRQKIQDAVYDELTLNKKEDFLRLVWMDSEGILGTDLYNTLTPRNETRTLKNLVTRIRQHIPGDSPHKIFEELNNRLSSLPLVDNYQIGTNTSMNNKWFAGCIAMNGTFDPRLIRELWVRDLLKHEKNQSANGTYYIEDGSHRALVYALNLDFNVVEYIPIKVRWCKSWRHIFPWAQEPES